MLNHPIQEEVTTGKSVESPVLVAASEDNVGSQSNASHVEVARPPPWNIVTRGQKGKEMESQVGHGVVTHMVDEVGTSSFLSHQVNDFMHMEY